jgi:hypothetical protein
VPPQYRKGIVPIYNAAAPQAVRRTGKLDRNKTCPGQPRRGCRMKSTPDSLMPLAAFVFLCVLGAVSDAQVTTPTYSYVFVPTVPQSDPRIFKVELNSDRLQAGGSIAIRVTTTPDVVAVETGNGPRSGQLTQISPGVFTTLSTLPRLGGLATIKISLHFVSKTTDGRSSSVDVPVHYR